MKLLIIDDEKPVRDCIKLLIPKAPIKYLKYTKLKMD